MEISARVYEFFNPYCEMIDKDAMRSIDWYTIRWICLDTNLINFDRTDIQRYIPNQHLNTININSHGFRGDDFSSEKLDNVYRIFVVGGSTTFGYGVSSNEKTIPGQLGNMFKNNNVEIINAGIGEATSFEEKYLIENNILQFEPDMIIVYDGGNDVRYEQLELRNYSDNQNKPNFQNYKFFRTPFVIYENFLRLNSDDSKFISIENDESINNKISQNWENNMKDICDIGSNNDISVVLFLQPLLGTEKPLSNDELKMFNDNKKKFSQNISQLDNLFQSSNNLKLNCLEIHDLRNIFKNSNESIFFDDVHLNEKGNFIIAEKIYQEIYRIIKNDIKN